MLSAGLLSANSTLTEYENNVCIHSKLESQSIQNPENTAIIQGDQRLNYRQLNDLSNGVANMLLDLGIKTEDYVVVCLERSFELIASIFGILKSGGVYVPVLPSFPRERKKFIVEDSKPGVIITTRNQKEDFENDIPVLFVEDFFDPEKLNFTQPQSDVKPSNLAYLIYTSGTTGKPKGVMIEHHSVMNRIGWMQKAYPIHSGDVLIQKTSIAFDVSVWELFWWSFTGAKLFLLEPGAEKDPQHLIQQIGKHKISVIHFVPSMLNEFVSYLKSARAKYELRNLKYIFSSGEALNVQSVKNLYGELADSGSAAKIINLYGPTEATVDVTHYLCSGNETKNIPIGSPIDNTMIFIVNESNNILGIDEKGELLITGVNLARGYLGREELTREKFIYLNVNGENVRAYRTGDIACWDYNCNLIYLGRNDNQIKLRGFRIELGEIESKLRTMPGLKDCAVIAHHINQSDATLIAFCVNEHGTNTSQEKAKAYLKEYLPDYMVPAQIHFIEKIPVTQNGKLNKEELIKVVERQNAATEPKNFGNNIQQTVYQIWCALLNKTNINPESNFFDQGGNSLLMVQMSILLKNEFNVEINIFDLFQYTNITSLSNFIKNKLNQ